MRFLFLAWLLLPFSLFASDAPISESGRIRPFTAYAKQWLYETYRANSIKKEHLDLLPIPIKNADELLWALHLQTHEPFDSFPLFFLDGKWLSYNEIKEMDIDEPLISRIKFYELFGYYNDSPDVPLHQSAIDMKMLPSQNHLGNWIPLKALLTLKDNPTAYSDEEFSKIKNAYLDLRRKNNDYQKTVELEEHLMGLLSKNYRTVGGLAMLKGSSSTLKLPYMFQLKTENFYFQFPWIWLVIALYCLSLILFITRPRWGYIALLLAFLMHTLILIMRCMILARPPVSNMYETVLFVPWVAVAFSWILYLFLKNRMVLLASALTACSLLILDVATYSSHELETVQPVLNSQFWLTVHVLMVVGSYGAFILSGILAHIYLIALMFRKMPKIPKIILQSLYIGTALLITGTILGGVWAAQSWGRFWDWDPKESWAFISSATYLVIIHAYRFGKIGSLGLAIGSIIGLQAITFTWYGVNYILGVGLHSYGFGSGGEYYYALFTGFEFIFVFFMLFFHICRRKISQNHLS